MKTTLEYNRESLIKKHHKNCLFKTFLKEDGELSFSFDNNGNLVGKFYCHKIYQGYNNRIHGGIIAAIIDESMVHCLMGHDIVGVTTNINIKYRLPIYLNQYIEIITNIEDKLLDGVVYKMKSEVNQNSHTTVVAIGEFFTRINNFN